MSNEVIDNEIINDLEELKEEIRSKYLLSQQINRYIQTEKFSIAYSLANDEERRDVHIFVKNLKKYDIIMWVQLRYLGHYELYSINNLRDIASRLGISHYYQMSKPILLNAIYSCIDKGTSNGYKSN